MKVVFFLVSHVELKLYFIQVKLEGRNGQCLGRQCLRDKNRIGVRGYSNEKDWRRQRQETVKNLLTSRLVLKSESVFIRHQETMI